MGQTLGVADVLVPREAAIDGLRTDLRSQEIQPHTAINIQPQIVLNTRTR